jgi:hypothetical protein
LDHPSDVFWRYRKSAMRVVEWSVGQVPRFLLIFGSLSLLLLSLLFPSGTTPLTELETLSARTCPTCYQCSANPVTSTKADLILTFCFEDVESVRDLLMSVRMCGIRSSLVLVVLKDTDIPLSIQSLLDRCDIDLFVADLDRSSIAPSLLRYFAYQQFLSISGSKYRRILHVEPNFVFFQGDPFTDSITSEGLHVVLDGESIGNSSFDSFYIAYCYGESGLSALSPYQLASSSVFGGDLLHFRAVVDSIANSTCPVDQVHYNHILWRTRSHHSRTYHGCSSQIVNSYYCLAPTILNEYRVFISMTGSEAMIYRAFENVGNLASYLHQLCNFSDLV